MSDLADAKSLSNNADGVYQEGDFENAARLYGEAASVFQAQGNVIAAAEMKNNQSVSYLQDKKAQLAYDAAAGTADVFAAVGDFRRQGYAFANQATPLQSLNRFDQAIEKYLQAAEAFKQADEDQLRFSVMLAVAGIYLRRWKISEALNHLSLGVADLKHPSLKQKLIKAALRLRVW